MFLKTEIAFLLIWYNKSRGNKCPHEVLFLPVICGLRSSKVLLSTLFLTSTKPLQNTVWTLNWKQTEKSVKFTVHKLKFGCWLSHKFGLQFGPNLITLLISTKTTSQMRILPFLWKIYFHLLFWLWNEMSSSKPISFNVEKHTHRAQISASHYEKYIQTQKTIKIFKSTSKLLNYKECLSCLSLEINLK